ncbi:MAG: uroporphyrinogen-III synthase [Chloroflexota bacterium]
MTRITHPLVGKRIVITRPAAQSSALVEMLREVGAIPLMFPTIQIAPIPDNEGLDSALKQVRDYEWVIFTSVNGVKIALDRMAALGLLRSAFDSCQIAVIGPATAAALSTYGLHAALQPDKYVAEAIVESLIALGSMAGKRFLLLRADIARATLREQLVAYGAIVDEIPVYQTVRGNPDPAAYADLRAGVDVLTFTSSSTVRYFFELLGSEALTIAREATIACIGPITAHTARDLGLHVDLVADDYTIPGLVAALEEKLQL